MNVHLGDLEEYVQEKLARGGYGSAAEVIREALRKMRELETEEARSLRAPRNRPGAARRRFGRRVGTAARINARAHESLRGRRC